MRRMWALVLIALIVIPMQSSAATESLWDDARITDEIGIKSGTIGGVSVKLSNTTNVESESGILDLPSIVEVYTATWCSNCIKTEQALDDAIGDLEVTRIHYTDTSMRPWIPSEAILPTLDGWTPMGLDPFFPLRGQWRLQMVG